MGCRLVPPSATRQSARVARSAPPSQVAQTFFVNKQVEGFARLDGIVTLVDAKHIEQHLDEEKPEGAENEAVEQAATL